MANTTVVYIGDSNAGLSLREPEGSSQPPWCADELRRQSWRARVIRMWSGTIVEFLTCSVPGDKINGWAPGTYWWGADSNLGFFGFESVTDGTANTGLFSEKLIGWSAAKYAGASTLYANGSEAKRGIYVIGTFPIAL